MKHFVKIFPMQTLSEFVKIIATSKRNIFPVVNDQNKLLGIIILDNVKAKTYLEILTMKDTTFSYFVYPQMHVHVYRKTY